jgi:RND family efflux transporter MFP subunit
LTNRDLPTKLLTDWSVIDVATALGPPIFPLSFLTTMKFQPIYRFACLSVALIALVGCSKPAPQEEPVRSVKVMTVGMEDLQYGFEYAGEVRARVESRLGFRVAGKIIKRQVDLGQHVAAGTVLAQLDAQDYRLSADAAKAQYHAALTNRDLVAADFKRYKELREQNFISGAELERREAALKAAQAQLDQAQAQLSGQTNQASYTTLMADVSGVVTSIDAEPGQVVASGASVVRIAQDGPRDVVFAVPEDKVRYIRAGTPAEVRVWSDDRVLKGVVREVAASTDPVTRTFAVKVGLNAKEDLPLGSTVNVTPQALKRSGLQAIKIPTSALHQDGHRAAVWVLDKASMTVKLVPIAMGTADGNDVVVTGGLKAGDLVVTTGVHVLSPDQKVTIFKEKEPLGPARQAQGATENVAIPAAIPSASAAK